MVISGSADVSVAALPSVRLYRLGPVHVYLVGAQGQERHAESSILVADTPDPDPAMWGSRVRISGSGVEAERDAGSGVPLYFAGNASRLVIATDLATLESLGVPLVADQAALRAHLAFGLLTGGRTYLAGVSQVQLGEHAQWNFATSGGPRRHLAALPPEAPLRTAAVDDVLVEILAAWRDRAHALLLSGGLDSALLYRLLYRRTAPRRTFSTDYWFHHGSGPEQRYAEAAAAELNADHLVLHFDRARYLEHMVAATEAARLPLPGLQTALIHGVLTVAPAAAASAFINGQGADALFGGPAPGADWRAAETAFGPWRRAWATACEILGVTGDPFTDRLHMMAAIDATEHAEPNRWRLYQLLMYTDKGQTWWIASARSQGHTMVFPFLDRRILAWAAADTSGALWSPGKPALRAAAARAGLSDQLIRRPKLSFGPTGNSWFAELADLHWLAADLVDRRSFGRLVALPESRFVVWNLLTYALWHRLFLNREPAAEIRARLNAVPATRE